jgi:hypothetical protein
VPTATSVACLVFGRHARAALGLHQQRQIVDHAHRLVDLDHQRGDVAHGHRAHAVEVVHHGAPHALQARLRVARQALVGLLERGQQRLGAAGDRGLLHGHAQRGLDVGQHVLVARARHRLQQVFELRALQRVLGHARLEQRHLGHGIARRVLGLAGQHARLCRERRAVLLTPHQLLLERLHALVGLPCEPQRGRTQHHRRQQQPPRCTRAATRWRNCGRRGIDRRARRRRFDDRLVHGAAIKVAGRVWASIVSSASRWTPPLRA